VLRHRRQRDHRHRVLIGPLGLLVAVALAAEPAADLQVLPLPWLDGPCQDPRYPRLAGEWAVGCGPSGRVDRALHLATRRTVALEGGAVSPGVAPGVVYAPTRDHGLWRLPSGETDPQAPLVPLAGIAPPATDGDRVALALADGLQLFRLDERIRHTWDASPAPWYPPALDGELVAWVTRQDGSEDIWALVDDQAVPVATTAAHERHVAVSGDLVGWVSDDGVHTWDARTGARQAWPTDAHTTRRLSLHDGVACWEAWNGVDVDVACSDGVRWGGEGHQRSPDRQGGQLLVMDRGRALLLVLPEAPSTGP